ncbi:MAG: 2-(1,2-epoxy-1,2-dihydrophenyl)acetyl-CoA isomerase [Candidatus Lokiarchaeota archaeon]|nr:2-(1,2-epoxy-1,2-dihydrophenyl)acetyl-CoA isomerase [Candidatus Lokiarchaeota archaeon]
MEYKYIIFELENNIAIITFNREDKLNAINGRMFDEIYDAMERIEVEKDIRAAIMTGKGRAFSTGGDFNQASQGMAGDIDSVEDGGKMQTGETEIDLSQKRIVLKMQKTPKPLIAAINGLALGGGLNIALNCDLVYASENAELGTYFMKRALIPEMSSTYILPRIVGIHKAKELIFFGDRFSAHEALEMGLLNDVFPETIFMEKVKDIAHRLAKGPTYSIGLAKLTINKILEENIIRALELEAENLLKTFDSEDFTEGLLAFFEKREPDFLGR